MVGDKPQILFLILKVCQKSVFFFHKQDRARYFFSSFGDFEKTKQKKSSPKSPDRSIFIVFVDVE